MKIIHCADIHLGSKMDSKLPQEKAEERRVEVRATFGRMVDYAKKEGVSAILLSGDVFDSDCPLKKDKQFFYDVVKSNPEIDFLYLRGNHDRGESYIENLKNLKTFSGQWRSYRYGNCVICGVELSNENCLSMYSALNLSPRDMNVVMLHGTAGEVSGADRINLLKLSDKNIDYLALGHIHSCKSGRLDNRGVYAYSGCLEGRGFDETGEKGFILLDITDKISCTFVPFSKRVIVEARVDISDTSNSYESYLKVRSQIKCDKKNLLRITLTGEIAFDDYRLKEELEEQLRTEYYFVSVRNETRRKIDLKRLAGDVTLKGEFIRCVLASNDYTEAQKSEIITAGLKALDGREGEL